MRKISLSDVVPHALAVLFFLLLTVVFFSPVFFENKSLDQNDIVQFLWGSKELRDYRAATGREGLWTNAMFSGMPAYLVNLQWSDAPVTVLKKVLSFFLPHPVRNIFLALVCYYLLLLSFRVRPYLAVAGALAFGLSTYMIIGLSAGHNARIGAIAFMPLVMAGIHLAFSGKKWLGFAATTAGLALHLRENHVQITYYLLLLVAGYGIMKLVQAVREKQLPEFAKTLGLLCAAAALALATFFGPLWAIAEYSGYSTRGASELVTSSANTQGSGLPKSYAFQYSNGIAEPVTALIPNFFGGSSFNAFVNDENSKTYQALMQSGDQNTATQLARYTSSYWGRQPLSAPYYAGAIVVFLFVIGLLMAERTMVVWLASLTVLGVMMSWGSNFEAFNYFLFDYLPGYNKFRSVTFVMVVVFFALPLLGSVGLERLLAAGLSPQAKKKLLIAFLSTGGLCLFFGLFAGLLSYTKEGESELPRWFLQALQSDRQALLRSDALRSFAFIFSIFILLYLGVYKKVTPAAFFLFLIAMTVIDLVVVNKRYFSAENYVRKSALTRLEPSAADQQILRDTGDYRVLDLRNFYDARASNFHQSLGGYHGARIKRYQELYDSCISRETERLIAQARSGALATEQLPVLNMLNTRYFLYGEEAGNVLLNPTAYGPAWYASSVIEAISANEELTQTARLNSKNTVVINTRQFSKPVLNAYDSHATVTLKERKPDMLAYEAQSSTDGLVVFSEIFYPTGWHAFIDGTEVPILRVNYVLRALQVPAGTHQIQFKFDPSPYRIGNKVTLAASWVMLIAVMGCLFRSLKREDKVETA